MNIKHLVYIKEAATSPYDYEITIQLTCVEMAQLIRKALSDY